MYWSCSQTLTLTTINHYLVGRLFRHRKLSVLCSRVRPSYQHTEPDSPDRVRCSRFAYIRQTVMAWITLIQARLLKFHRLLSTYMSAGSSSDSNSSRVGPKSDHTCGNPSRTRVITALLHVLLWSRVTPGDSARVDVRVDFLAKHVGFGEAQPPIHNQDISSCAKRTYRRAYARACREGGSYYKGQWREHHWFRPVMVHTRALSAIFTNFAVECRRVTLSGIPRAGNMCGRLCSRCVHGARNQMDF